MTSVRPDTTVPDTKLHNPVVDADRAHEDTLRYFVEETELGVLDHDQQGIIALVASGQKLGMQLPASSLFFEVIRQLSSGFEGKGRIQVKEVITAGSFPMSLLFQQPQGGIIESLKGLFGRRSEPSQVKQ